MAEENANGEEEAKPKSPLKLIILVAVVMLVLGGGGAYFLLGSKSSAPAPEVTTTEGSEETAEVKEPKAEAVYFSLDPRFVVNFVGKSKARFLQVQIDGVTRDPMIKEDVTLHLPKIRNNILMLLSSKTYNDLSDPEGKEQLRQEVLTEIQSILKEESGHEGVEDIFFTSFVMQ